MAGPDLLTHVRDYLIAQGLVRDPEVAGSKPPFWRQPRDGAVAPGERSGNEDGNPVISAFLTGGIVGGIFDVPTFRQKTVDIWIRSRTGPPVESFESELTPLMAANGTDAKFDFDMAGLHVIQSQLWRDLQWFPADDQSFTATVSYLLTIYA